MTMTQQRPGLATLIFLLPLTTSASTFFSGLEFDGPMPAAFLEQYDNLYPVNESATAFNDNIHYLNYVDIFTSFEARTLIRYQLTANSSHSYSSYSYPDYHRPLSGSIWLDFGTYNISSDSHRVDIYLEDLGTYDTSFNRLEKMTIQASSDDLLNGQISLGLLGEPDDSYFGDSYISSGEPLVCVECGYSLLVNLPSFQYDSNGQLTVQPGESHPSKLFEFNEYYGYDSSVEQYQAFVSEVPIPAAGWLFGSALLALGRWRSRKE